jgi:hypothetical protein
VASLRVLPLAARDDLADVPCGTATDAAAADRRSAGESTARLAAAG